MARAKLLFSCLIGVNLFAQPAGRGAISGAVVDASSGDPVRKAVVTLTWHGTPRAWATARTDGSGKFAFEGLPAGKYDLRATKQGLGSAVYGANSARELGDVISLGDGEARGDIKLRFLRLGLISGRVVDPDGDPVAGVNVTLMRAARNLDGQVLQNAQGANTNDRGEYQITGVNPGEYYLRCIPNMPRMGPQAFRTGRQPAHEIVVSQFYGSARNFKEAAPLMVRAGDVLNGIDFHLTAERPAIIMGRVTGVPALDQPEESPAPGRWGGEQGISVNLSPADETQFAWGGGTSAQAPDFKFELGENVPGRYRLDATVTAKGKKYSAFQIIEAHEGENEVILSIVPAVEVKGHLKVEGTGHSADGFTVILAPTGSMPRRGGLSSSVKQDGSFTIEDVPPGEWQLNINPTPQGLFEKSVRIGDKDFLFKHVEIPPGSDAPLEIVISSNTSAISGEVDAGGEGKRAGILLAPVGARHTLARFYYSAIADDGGKFGLNHVAPGKYKIFALENIATANFRTPESADLLDALGEELEVPEAGKVEAHPKLIPEGKAKELLKP
jgi:protocatechuate 3,4-dioxygenase beta subunit